MSLIGSLEDLSLGDILQIISLSQKSGVLSIRGEDGEGSIVLQDGLVRGGHLKGGPMDLRGVLVGGRFLEGEEFDDACERARREGTTVEEALAAYTSLSAERIDSLRRECVEAAVMAMFAWQTGEFSFDVRGEPEMDAPPLLLPDGINAQYLAMEGSRIEDESAHVRQEWRDETGAGSIDEPCGQLPEEPPEMSAEEMFGIEGEEALEAGGGFAVGMETDDDPDEDTQVGGPGVPEPAAIEALGLAVAERVDSDGLEAEPVLVETPDEPAEGALEADEGQAFAEPLEPPQEAPIAPAPPASEAVPVFVWDEPLVLIDPDLVALEWMKQTLQDVFPRIHIFQRWDLGLNPIRQYLARASRPVVMLGPGARGDPLSGIRGGHDFVARLKAQQPLLPVLWLQENEEAGLGDLGEGDGALTRPSSAQLRNPRAAGRLQQLAEVLRQDLATILSRGVSASKPASAAREPHGVPRDRRSPDGLGRLREVTQALADASSRGEVLPMAIRFAAEIFERVAMFMVRGDSLVGMAQHGLPTAGGPEDEGLRQVELSRHGSAWFRSVLEGRHSIRCAPSDGGDYTLAALLGNAAAREAYLAPIESGGEIVAILYADNLPHHRPLADTEALDVVLQHVGLALERAMLERALEEAQNDPL